ncbi:MAG: hypothetical protein KatS3mg085_045 [Candidatus Dojkabacteria bacterium]|nr:MAG: hypothetical protein KatS3mg085_045 [Candidatus Dojkabacteria bacterium]
MTNLYSFCSFCGGTLVTEKQHFKCSKCSKLTFRNPAPCTAIFLIKANKVLLTIRAIEPFKGMLDALGGFVEPNESFEDAAIRESTEEIGFAPTNLEYLCSFPDTYLYQDVYYDVLNVSFASYMDKDIEFEPNDDVESVKWFKYDEIDFNLVAFDSVKKALKFVKQKLK